MNSPSSLLADASQASRPLELRIVEASPAHHYSLLSPEVLSFVSVLFWQIIFLVFAFYYRNELRAFLLRINTIKLFGAEVGTPTQEASTATLVEQDPIE
jgi:hypothetical protein